MEFRIGKFLLSLLLIALTAMLGAGSAGAQTDSGQDITIMGSNTEPLVLGEANKVTVAAGATLNTPGDAITFTGTGNTVLNYGAITGEYTGIMAAYSGLVPAGFMLAEGEALPLAGQTITNYGSITGYEAINFGTSGSPEILDSSYDDTINNYGTITGTDDRAIRMGAGNDLLNNYEGARINGTIGMGQGDDKLYNWGMITTIYGEAAGLGDGNDRLENHGTISVGRAWAGIHFSEGDDVFVNTGTISMSSVEKAGIAMGGGNDTFDNSGTITVYNAGEEEYPGSGIKMGNYGTKSFTNSGTITIGSVTDTGISMNVETFYGDRSFGVTAFNEVAGSSSFTNSGEIGIGYAGFNGIAMGYGDNMLNNSGKITIDQVQGFDYDGYYIGGNGILMLEGGANTFTNSGTITIGNVTGAGILMGYLEDFYRPTFLEGSLLNGVTGGASFNNSGEITIVNAGTNGIAMGYGDNTFENSGKIEINNVQGYYDYYYEGFLGGNGIEMGQDGVKTFINSGTIDIGYANMNGINMGGYEPYYEGYAPVGTGFNLLIPEAGNSFTNSGTINIGYAGNNALSFGYGADAFLNSGALNIGKADNIGISMNDGNDVFTNSGTITIGTSGGAAIGMGCESSTDGNDNDTFTNTGVITITRAENSGIGMGYNGDDVFNNSGAITIGYAGYSAISMGDYGNDVFTNSGSIDIGYANNNGIHMGREGDKVFTNSGAIRIEYADKNGINFGAYTGNSTFTNTGTIEIGGAGNAGIHFADDGFDTFVNSGTIKIGPASSGAICMGDDDDSFTNSGTILAGQGWIKAGPGNDVLVNEGTLEGNILMGQGNDSVSLRSGSVLIGFVDGGCDYGYPSGVDSIVLEGQGKLDGDIRYFADMTKTGEGTWTLNGNSIVDYTWVEAGTLWLNGDLTPYNAGPAAAFINPGATLAMNGVAIGGNVTNFGTLDLGGNMKASTISGDYTHGSEDTKATLSIGAGNGVSDSLNVTGTAIINGGTLFVKPVGVVQDGDKYTVLTAGTLAGAFDQATANSAVLSFGMDTATVPNSLIIDAHRQAYIDALAGSGLSGGNLGALSNTLMQIIAGNPTGDWATIIAALDNLPNAGALADALNQMSSEPFTMGLKLANLTTSGYIGNLTQRMADLRTYMVASNRLTESGPSLSQIMAERQKRSGWSPWVKTFYTKADQDASGGFMGYDYHTWGVNLGIDNAVSQKLLVGAVLGFASSNAETDGNISEIDADSYQFGLYGSWDEAKFYVDGALMYARNSYDSTRNINFGGLTGAAKGDHDGDDYVAYVGAGYKMAMADWNLIPTVSLQYGHHKEDSFTETGAGALNLDVDSADSDSLVSKAGFRVNRIFQMNGYALKPELSLQWAHEFGDRDQQASARFNGTTVGTFNVSGVETDRDSGILGLGLTAFLKNNISLFANYYGEFREDFTAHNVAGGLRYEF